MAKGRELKGRIKSVENTRKITRTMEMVATSKMKRAVDRVTAARPYAEALTGVISSLYSEELAARYPLLRQPETIRRAAVILITSNRGLAGAFNSNLIKEGRTLVEELEGRGIAVELHAVGRKGAGFFRYINRDVKSVRLLEDRPSAESATEVVDALMADFINGTIDAVYVVHAAFKSALSTPPARLQVLPVEPPQSEGGAAAQRDFLLFPSADAILQELLPSLSLIHI